MRSSVRGSVVCGRLCGRAKRGRSDSHATPRLPSCIWSCESEGNQIDQVKPQAEASKGILVVCESGIYYCAVDSLRHRQAASKLKHLRAFVSIHS